MNKITNGSTSTLIPSTMDKNKDWQLELLMEKIRSKASQYKSFQETSKTVRMTMLDKRYSLDSVEKSQHQKCLDTLQHCIKVTSLQSMVERLESLTRQLGLKFMPSPSGVELFISSDMFYLEIILDQSGAVRDVKVHHEGKMEQQSCAELVSCLSRQDFADFTAQLEGFASIYQLNAEKKIKCKAFTALQSLESDLSTLAQLQTFVKEPFNVLHKSPVGLLEKRRGGHPMKLTYFVSPYDLVNEEKGELEPITVEAVTSKNLGYSVTVCMEGSAAHKLQTTTLITVNRSINGKGSPLFAALSNQNSAVIPACFMLKLNKPMPMCVSLVRKIQQLTDLECAEMSSTHPLLSLISSHASDGKMESGNNKGMFVTLPDQSHCYFMTESKSMEGILVHGIPFTHPGHVTEILEILRQQALFNTIIGSCVRPNSRQDFENMIMFEISALSWTHISISMENPIEETMATAEVDLSDISKLQCRIHSPGTPLPPNTPDTTSEHATKVLNRCLSIPVTMRSIIQLWDKQVVRKNHFNGHENFNLPLGSGDPGGHKGPPGNGLSDFGGLDGKIKQEPSNGGGMNLPLMSHSHQGVFLNESMIASANFSNFPAADTPMLTNMELANILAGTGQSEKSSKRQHKRKTGDDPWKGMKRKGEDSELLLETSSSDSTSRSTPLSQETPSEISMMTPNSAMGFQSDLELSALDASELIGGPDKGVPEYDNIDDLGDVEEMLSSSKEHKIRKSQKSPSSSAILDLGENKTLVPPSVSITPINTPQGFNSLGMERRPGIEIIPIATTPPTSLPSSITITPISSAQIKNMEERSREKKSSKSRSEDKNRLEKKRKRKRDESPMGPPEKIPPKQDPLSKPVSVSIKPAESPPLPPITPTSPSSMMRKFSASPTQTKSFSVSGKLSPSMMKSGIKSSSSSHQSPKHSPAHVPSSPKHTIPGISSPKSHGTSPKHPSTGSSGKPSMSTLKSAANSPSSKSSIDSLKSKSTNKESSRDKEKKFSVSNSNKVKSSSVKLKQLDLSTDLHIGTNQGDSLPSPNAAADLVKSNNPGQVRNRKGSLSAIVDKLKSAQHCDNATDLSTKSSSSRSERSGQTTSKTIEGGSSKSTSGKTGENKNSEYMVKPSSDGIKITINKTRTKESSKSLLKSSSGTGSPKTHTGLKPGVNSGPASKKPQQSTQKSSSSPNITNSTNYGSFKSKNQLNSKSSSSSSLSSSLSSKSMTKLSGSPKTGPSSATDLSRSKDRPRINKSSSEKSIFSSSRERKSSPTQNREESESEKAFKLALSKMDPYSTAPLMAEGLIKKQLDKNFQIPKLSARNSEDKKMSSNKVATSSENLNNVNPSKMFDMMTKNDVTLPTYPLNMPTTKMFDTNMEAKIRNSMNMMASSVVNSVALTTSTSSPKSGIANSQHKDINNEYNIDNSEGDRKKDTPQNLSTGSSGKDDINYKHNFPISAMKSFPSGSVASDLSSKSVDLTSKFAASATDIKKDSKNFSNKDVGDVLLDFSNSTNKTESGKCSGGSVRETGGQPAPPYTSSSSVSVHIVKSPAPSPHSASPCITDDELMDEALVGLGKKIIMECKLLRALDALPEMKCPRNIHEMNNDTMVFQQNDLFPAAFPCMEDIRRQGKLCDVVLRVDDQAFSAHKIVLASTIPYFHAMFTNDMIESRQNEIIMQGIEATSLEALINFAYSGRVLLDKNNVQSIMIGASFLQLNKVRDACATFLLKRLHPQNAIGIRQFADTLGCTSLVDSANKYIEHCFHEVSLSEEFLNLPLQDVQNLLTRNELRVESLNVSEEQVFEACMRWVKHSEGRTCDLPQLLSQVRLPLLSPLYLTDRVATEELIRTSHQCRDLLDEARVFHLIPERRHLLQSFRTKPRACEVRGYIYVVGGLNRHGDSLSTVEYYDPDANEWQLAPSMSMLRSRLGVAVLRGKLYAFGGYNGKDRLASVEVYDAVKEEWATVSPMQCKRSALGATSLGDLIYVCGGYDGVTSLNSVERYHPQTNTWSCLTPMNKSRSAGAVIACQGYVYALGGHDGLSIFDSVERYDPNTDTWTEATPMLTKRCRLGVAMLSGKLYACGGYDGSCFLQTVEMFDPNTNKWTYVASMNAQRSRVALTANMGKLWAVGGYDGISNLVSVEVYDPLADKWTYTAPMMAHEGGVGLGVISLP